jgi:hypothetical protein
MTRGQFEGERGLRKRGMGKWHQQVPGEEKSDPTAVWTFEGGGGTAAERAAMLIVLMQEGGEGRNKG